MRGARRVSVGVAIAVLLTVAAAAQAPTMVIVQNFSFQPREVTIAAGGSVQWTNRDGAPHQIESDDGTIAGPAMNPQESFTFVFRTAGRVTYHCAIHPSMAGAVIVQ